MRTSRSGASAAVIGALSASAALWTPAAGQEQVPPLTSEGGAGFAELDRETSQAIEDGVRWLATQQLGGSGRWTSTPQRYQMSVTALAGLALLAHGDTPDSGKHAQNVRRAVEWVLDSQKGPGTRWAGLLFDGRDDAFEQEDRPMHGHGFALLFLAEAYGQTREPALRERMHAAISLGARLTERTITRDGGWFYTPDSPRDEGSVTITQIQALRSAQNAGISVDTAVVDRAVEYIKASQDVSTGGVRYTLRWGKTSCALTSAGMSVLHGAGVYSGEAIDRGFAFLRSNLTCSPNQPFFYYTHLYTAQAMFQRGGAEWANYFPRIRRELLDVRRNHPYWDSDYGKAYGSANALLILQLPLRYLPIFQR